MSPEPRNHYKGDEERPEVGKSDQRRECSNKVTVEEIVNLTIGSDNSKASRWKFLCFLLLGMLGKMVGPILANIPIFTGFLNYKDWECLSTKCTALMTNFTGEPVKFFSRHTICNNLLEPKVDFKWTTERTSYALEWGLSLIHI